MRRTICVAALAIMTVLTLGALEPRLEAQKQSQLFISLTAPDGTPVGDLKADEVNVTVDDVECKILKLEPINWPVKLQVLVDNGKLTTTPINSLRAGLKALFEAIPDGVEMSMYTTAGSPRQIVRPTTDRQMLVDGIALIGPDTGAGMFFDALSQAVSRIDRDKSQNFPVILMVASDFGRVTVINRDYQRLLDTILKRAVTVHVILMAGDIGSASGGAEQTEIGLAVAKVSGGRYEGINGLSRLTTLLPELGKRIAESHQLQSHQYRITYERPANAKDQARIAAAVRREGTPSLSLDGHLP